MQQMQEAQILLILDQEQFQQLIKDKQLTLKQDQKVLKALNQNNQTPGQFQQRTPYPAIQIGKQASVYNPPYQPQIQQQYQSQNLNWTCGMWALISVYSFLTIACIIGTRLLCGSLNAFNLWISSFVLYLSSLILIHFSSTTQNKILFILNAILFIISMILEIVAVALAIRYPESFYTAINQNVGKCTIYSDTITDEEKQNFYEVDQYWNAIQYGCLACFSIQFIVFGIQCYRYYQYNSLVYRQIINSNQQVNPSQQQMVILDNSIQYP